MENYTSSTALVVADRAMYVCYIITIAAIMLNNTFTMQSNDDGDKADADHVTAGEVHDSYPPVEMSAEKTKRPHDDEEEAHSATGSNAAVSGVDSRKRHAIAVPVDSSLPPGVIAAASGNSNTVRSGGNSSGGVSRFTTSAAMTPQQQQQQQYEQIHELLMQQSVLRSSTEPLQQQHQEQQRNLELLSSVQRQRQLEPLMISNYPTGNTRMNELQQLLLLDQVGRSGPTSNNSPHNNDQDLRRLLLDQQNGATYVNILDYIAPSMSSNLSSLALFQQQQHMNLFTSSSTNLNSHRAAMSNTDFLLQELLMSQQRSTDLRNHVGSVAAINNTIRSRFFANTIPTRIGEGSAHGPGRAASEPFLSTSTSTSAVASNLRAAATAQLLSPRNKGTSSSSSSVIRSTSELDVDNEDSEEKQQSITSSVTMLQQRLQDPIVVADRTREAVLSELLDTQAQQATMGAFDRHANNLPTSSMIQQLQQVHHERLLAAARDEELQSATLQSLLASNHLHNVARARVTERAAIHNSAVMTVPMDCESDTEQLSKYQVLIRRQLEYFVSHDDDVAYSVQGRKKQIVVGQVGIRCRHCSYLPHRLRGRGAGYYPAKLSGVYQAAQNMATNHLNQHCNIIPAAIREELCSLRGGRHESSAGGGKQYWTNKCTEIGLIERDDGVYFR